MKKVLIGLAVVVALGVGAVFFVQWYLFGGLKPLDPDAKLDNGTIVIEGGFVSTWIVDAGNGEYFLVDAGLADDGSAIKAKLAEMGASPDDVTAIVLTHGHNDHIAGAASFPNAKVYVHEADAGLTEGTETANGPLTQYMANDFGVKVAETFVDGDVIELGERKLKVYHTPGHTAGHSMFLLDGALFLGDGAGVTKEDELRPPPNVFTDDPEQAIASVRELSKRFESEGVKPEVLVPAHSGMTTDIDALKRFPVGE